MKTVTIPVIRETALHVHSLDVYALDKFTDVLENMFSTVIF
jgi:hypothetical protein